MVAMTVTAVTAVSMMIMLAILVLMMPVIMGLIAFMAFMFFNMVGGRFVLGGRTMSLMMFVIVMCAGHCSYLTLQEAADCRYGLGDLVVACFIAGRHRIRNAVAKVVVQ